MDRYDRNPAHFDHGSTSRSRPAARNRSHEHRLRRPVNKAWSGYGRVSFRVFAHGLAVSSYASDVMFMIIRNYCKPRIIERSTFPPILFATATSQRRMTFSHLARGISDTGQSVLRRPETKPSCCTIERDYRRQLRTLSGSPIVDRPPQPGVAGCADSSRKPSAAVPRMDRKPSESFLRAW